MLTTEKKKGRPKKWNGMCPSLKHGLDFQGQHCDMCQPRVTWAKIDPPRPPPPPTCDLCLRLATWKHPFGGLRCNSCPRPRR